VPFESHTLPQTLQAHAVELFLHGHVIEASACLSEAISRDESADLWNDWAVVQLSLAEQAFRRALELGPSNADASANLGFLLFTMGRVQEASVLLKKSLAGSTGPALAQIQTLLRICSSIGAAVTTREDSCPNKLGCAKGKTPLLQRGQKVGRPRGSEFYQAWRCNSCGFLFFDSPKLEFLADYYKGEYTNAAACWYNADNDYDPVCCEARAADILHYAEKYCDTSRPVIHECGCSFGGTVSKLQSLGFQATGTDLNSTAIGEGSKRGNKWIFAESERVFFARQTAEFNIIYLYHALEHMPAPVDFLKDIRSAIQKNGIAFIAVPNSLNYFSLSKSFSENSWFAYPDHLNYFSPGSLPCLARAAGYSILELETRMVASTQQEAESLFPFSPDSHQWRLTERLIHQALMGHELRFVLTPNDSTVADRFAGQILATQAICESAKEQEVRMLDFCAQ
jgi:2-polyprenyl-3-methyl-5-hydroxy-6-metoxy-1,4-benzoquinol methylase